MEEEMLLADDINDREEDGSEVDLAAEV